jgi:thioredoxin-dependent peroxiredoxin
VVIRSVWIASLLALIGLVSCQMDRLVAQESRAPEVGEAAPDFSLKTIEGESVQLSKILENGPAVVVLLRGYPGYQCPLCSRQVASLISAKKSFADKKATVVMVYPGEASGLGDYAKAFMGKTELPDHFVLAIDPDYEFTRSYGLRWEAKNETAYPSTFVISKDGKVKKSWVSQSHGGRADTKQVVAELP